MEGRENEIGESGEGLIPVSKSELDFIFLKGKFNQDKYSLRKELIINYHCQVKLKIENMKILKFFKKMLKYIWIISEIYYQIKHIFTQKKV